MKRWQRIALLVLPVAVVVFAALFLMQVDATRDERAKGAASAAQVEALTEQVAKLEDALRAANAQSAAERAALEAKIDALAMQVQSLGGEPVATSNNGGRSSTEVDRSPAPSPEPSSSEPECTINLFGVCV